jgi:hypothetical protein
VASIFLCVRIWVFSALGVEICEGAVFVEHITSQVPDKAKRVPLEVTKKVNWQGIKWFVGYERHDGPGYVDRYVYIPLWMPAVLLASLSLVCWYRARSRRRPGICHQCGYALGSVIHISKRCPECGTEVISLSDVPSEGSHSRAAMTAEQDLSENDSESKSM